MKKNYSDFTKEMFNWWLQLKKDMNYSAMEAFEVTKEVYNDFLYWSCSDIDDDEFDY